MALKIVTADERLAAAASVNIALFGPSGVGKTTQLRTLDPKTTLMIDLEAGTLAIGEWPGGVVDVRAESSRLGVHPWMFAKAMACWLGGPDPSVPQESAYSAANYAMYCQALGDPKDYAQYKTLFWDSITVASRYCFSWCSLQPDAFTAAGKPDPRGAFGLLGRELVEWLTQIQHIKGRSTVVVGILDRQVDDLQRVTYAMQIDGKQAGLKLPGIFDEVVTLQVFHPEGGPSYRAFVTNQDNAWGYPAKDRSGCLEPLEPPDLGALMRKIEGRKRLDTTLSSGLPTPPAATLAA